jgi:hypothetical protein
MEEPIWLLNERGNLHLDIHKKIIIWAPKTVRKVATTSTWDFANHLVIITCFVSGKKWDSRKMYPLKTHHVKTCFSMLYLGVTRLSHFWGRNHLLQPSIILLFSRYGSLQCPFGWWVQFFFSVEICTTRQSEVVAMYGDTYIAGELIIMDYFDFFKKDFSMRGNSIERQISIDFWA